MKLQIHLKPTTTISIFVLLGLLLGSASVQAELLAPPAPSSSRSPAQGAEVQKVPAGKQDTRNDSTGSANASTAAPTHNAGTVRRPQKSAAATQNTRKRVDGGPAKSGDDDDTSDLDVERLRNRAR